MRAVKLYGWSILLDLFHGVLHPVATSAANFVMEMGPRFHTIAESYVGNERAGMDIICRILFDVQQDY